MWNVTLLKVCLAALWLGTVVACGGSGQPSSGALPPGQPPTSAVLPKGARALQPADVSTTVSVAKREIPALTPGEYRVSGEQRFNGWFLSAERVVFEADAKLIFSQT